jgi:hypothetical protein
VCGRRLRIDVVQSVVDPRGIAVKACVACVDLDLVFPDHTLPRDQALASQLALDET